ncbi:MAG: hypothetical protein OEZ24_04690 [Candidatus Bathyarchaeota archaeon]|nr:hypothetical protein [Candidatus Bathyarchaeota archaeon]
MEEEKIRKIAQLREMLEERTERLEVELEGMRTLLSFINELLLEKSFRRAEEMVKPAVAEAAKAMPQPPPAKERVKTVPLKTRAGELLANLYVEDDLMRITPAPDKRFDVNTPPFTAFLVQRILGKMRDRDQELVREGRMMPEEALSYDISEEEDVLQGIVIRNFHPQRERELRSATRWTLEKMYEKTQSST